MVTADVDGIQAIHIGDWKYIDNTLPDGLPDKKLKNLEGFKPQLYNLAKDPAETTNLYNENPNIVKKLLIELNSIRKASFTR